MKKRIPVALILAMVLILAAMTALAAAGFLDYAATLLQRSGMQDTSFQDWPARDKAELVEQLANSGYLASDETVNRLLSGKMEEGEAGRLAESILTDWLDAPVDHVAFRPIMEKIWGVFSSWTLEQKAWFTQAMTAAGMQGEDVEKFVLPGPEHISQSMAVRSAQAAAEIWMGVPAGAFNGYGAVAEFIIFPEKRPDASGAMRYTTEGVPPCWFIQLSPPEGTENASSCYVEVDAFTARADAQSLIGHLEYGRYYLPAASELQRAQHYAPFFDWPPEAKAEWSEKVRPQVLETEEKRPGSCGYPTVAFSQYVYGVPDETAIHEKDALAIAAGALQRVYGVDAKRLDLYNLAYSYYDITDPDQPKWRFHLSAFGESADILSDKDYSRLRNYRIEIDARTGELLSLEEYPQGDYTGYGAVMKWL